MKLAHISDVHAGRFKQKRLALLRRALDTNAIDLSIVTGDVTNAGKQDELDVFMEVFGDLIQGGKMLLVPGNHDRLGDDVAQGMMEHRVIRSDHNGIRVIRIDTTGPHNKLLVVAHGIICHTVISDVEKALEGSDPTRTVLAFHHHPVPLPRENLWERFTSWVKWPYSEELALGDRLIDASKGRATLMLHGHRHIPSDAVMSGLRVYNAGCTPSLRRFRVFAFGEPVGPGSEWVVF